jgi:dTDP-4-amino-4,6-dideoxygalactose transaminase
MLKPSRAADTPLQPAPRVSRGEGAAGSMALYHLAPSGTPIAMADLAEGLRSSLAGDSALDAFRDAVRRRYDVRYCFFVSTGRAAFALILEAMRAISDGRRDEVVVPSYTCYSVPASVARAGLKVRVCDVDAATLDYDPQALERCNFERVLCIASANLYGIPNDLERLRAVAAAHGAFVLDDAAQSMEAKFDGRFSGTLGDVGLFSLDKGKNITTIDGGIIVTNRADIGAWLESRLAALPAPALRRRVEYVAKLAAYAGLLRPRLYWIPENMPMLKLGTTPYPRDIPLQSYPAFLAAVGKRLFARIGQITAARVRNAEHLLASLHDLPGVRAVHAPPRSSPVYLRLPLIVPSEKRDAAIAALRRAGIGATGSFPTSVVDIPGIESEFFRGPVSVHGGRRVAAQILTVPTHPYVDSASIERCAMVLRRCMS